jgi:2-oxoisovalerate dehydrogenase E1 component
MKKTKLRADFDWQMVVSEDADQGKLGKGLSARMLFQIYLINAFERSIIDLKADDCVNGPIHLSIGQEAIASAAMAALTDSDRIAGSHRAHHQFLAKALNHVLPGKWDPTRDDLGDAGSEVVRRTLAEIMGLSPGYCGGRGGSMHLRWEEAGVLGTNAIVAGGVPLSTGAAYAEKFRKSGNIIVSFLGDGAANQGSFHEAANLAGIWDLPIIYFIENNQYAVATAAAEVCAINDLSQHAAAYGIDARLVYGYDVAAIYRTVKSVADGIRGGRGPCIIEAKCYRHLHHGGDIRGSQYGYRTKTEEEDWLARDAHARFPVLLRELGVLNDAEVARINDLAETAVAEAVDACAVKTAHGYTVRPEFWPDPSTAGQGIRSDGSELAGLEYKEAEGFPSSRSVKYSDAIAEVTKSWIAKDSGVVVLGEEVANFGGGAYGATRDLPKMYPDRIINTPISEAGFSGLGLGMAMSGMRPVVEIMFPDFTLVAADQIFNQIGKARHMYGGNSSLPLVLRTRIATGCGYGGQHSMDPVGLYAAFSGWRIVAPSNAFDYIGLFNTAMQSEDPVVFLEHHSLYTQEFSIPTDEIDYCVPFGKAKVVAAGDDITVVAYGSLTGRVDRLADAFAKESVSVEIVDLRTVDLANVDFTTIGESVKKTGAVVVVEEAALGQGVGQRLCAEITERFFNWLDAPPGTLASLDVPTSVSRVLEEAAVLGDGEILETVTKMARREWR